MTCSLASHAALRVDAGAFMSATRHLDTVDDVYYANCLLCDSTLALPCCFACGVPLGSADCLELRGDRFGHFACAVGRALEKGAAKFVAVVRVGTARGMR